MLQVLLARLKQGHRTIPYPARAPTLPERFRGLPVIDSGKCPTGCRECVEACPTGAISDEGGRLRLDLGKCLFCTDCVEACPERAISYSQDYRMATRSREDLVYDGRAFELAKELDAQSLRLF